MTRYNWFWHNVNLWELARAMTLDLPLDMIRRLFKASVSKDHQGFASMLANLWNLRNRECIDDKDRIFAIKELCTDLKPKDLEENYKLSVAQVLTDAARKIIEINGNLNVLGACLPERKCPNLPSWVPDWTICSGDRPIRILTPVHHMAGIAPLMRCEKRARDWMLHLQWIRTC